MKRVLLIDDRPVFRLRAERRLRASGHLVLTAGDPVAGLQRAIEDAPDLVAASMTVAEMAGLSLRDCLAREETTRRLPVVLFSRDALVAVESVLGDPLGPATWPLTRRSGPPRSTARR